MNTAINGSAVGVGGHLTASSLSTFNGFPAAEYVIAVKGEFLKSFIVQTPRRVYTLQVGGSDDPPAGYDKFTASFSILGG